MVFALDQGIKYPDEMANITLANTYIRRINWIGVFARGD